MKIKQYTTVSGMQRPIKDSAGVFRPGLTAADMKDTGLMIKPM